jgi:outer membrane protein OmpA-like peptidoglycan-associated protein
VNSDKWDSQPSISADGSTIYFVSDRPGGYGQTDLYVVKRNPFGDWAVPMNLGSVVNTPFHEYSPFISPDGKTLYYSSFGHPGFGDLDLFVTVFENSEWSMPRNLGAPLNSSGDDRYFTIGGSGEVGYFASNRAGSVGRQDLYEIAIPEDMRPQPTVVVSGTVTSVDTGEPLGAWVLVEDLQNGDLVATYKSNQASGQYLVVLPAGRDYSVSATREGFFFYSQRFTVADDARYQEITRDIPLSPIAEGATVVLNNVFFETGSAELSPESRFELGKVVDLMTQNPTVVIEVGGHTDNVGSEETNMRLSHNRAMSVREFLVGAGVPEARVEAKGYGETNPVASNETDEGRQANRRTEIIIIEG